MDVNVVGRARAAANATTAAIRRSNGALIREEFLDVAD